MIIRPSSCFLSGHGRLPVHTPPQPTLSPIQLNPNFPFLQLLPSRAYALRVNPRMDQMLGRARDQSYENAVSVKVFLLQGQKQIEIAPTTTSAGPLQGHHHIGPLPYSPSTSIAHCFVPRWFPSLATCASCEFQANPHALIAQIALSNSHERQRRPSAKSCKSR